jgi:hypothetical protein
MSALLFRSCTRLAIVDLIERTFTWHIACDLSVLQNRDLDVRSGREARPEAL